MRQSRQFEFHSDYVLVIVGGLMVIFGVLMFLDDPLFSFLMASFGNAWILYMVPIALIFFGVTIIAISQT